MLRWFRAQGVGEVYIFNLSPYRATDAADAVREGFGSREAFLAYFGTLHPGPVDLTLPVWVVSFEVVT